MPNTVGEKDLQLTRSHGVALTEIGELIYSERSLKTCMPRHEVDKLARDKENSR